MIPNAGKLTALSTDEMNMLLAFIEATTSLIKLDIYFLFWYAVKITFKVSFRFYRHVKLLIIRHSSIEADLYNLAAAVDINLERVHPGGKLVQGVSNLILFLYTFDRQDLDSLS